MKNILYILISIVLGCIIYLVTTLVFAFIILDISVPLTLFEVDGYDIRLWFLVCVFVGFRIAYEYFW